MNKILINSSESEMQVALLEDDKLVEFYEEDELNKSREGNIYLGKIKNIVQGIQAVFVDIGEKKNGYMYIEDILDKVNETKTKINKLDIANMNLSSIVKQNDIKMVQVKKDGIKNKGDKLSTHISIQGKYTVLLPNTDIITISKKIDDDNERRRLLDIVYNNILPDFGCIIRSAAKSQSKENIILDFNNNIEIWNKIINIEGQAPCLIYSECNLLDKVIKNMFTHDIDAIYVNDEKIYKYILKNYHYETDNTLLAQENCDLIKKYCKDKEIKQIKERKVYLKCGGFITVDKTEALTAIDVNSGKYINGNSLEETVFTVNREACIEIIRQLRLKNISGIVIVDFIDMLEEEHKQEVLSLLKQEARKDKANLDIRGFTQLNLLELTRKPIIK